MALVSPSVVPGMPIAFRRHEVLSLKSEGAVSRLTSVRQSPFGFFSGVLPCLSGSVLEKVDLPVAPGGQELAWWTLRPPSRVSLARENLPLNSECPPGVLPPDAATSPRKVARFCRRRSCPNRRLSESFSTCARIGHRCR